MAKKYHNSPVGVALYPWVNKPDTKFNDSGLFKVNLALSGEAAEKERAMLDKLVQEAFEEHTKDMTAAERKKWSPYVPYEVEEDDDGHPTGRIIVQYRQNAKIKLKDGTVKDVAIGIYDSKDQPMHKAVFGGSELRVRYSARAIVIASTKKAGVRLDFSAVQVAKLVSGTGGGGFGGTIDGGYEEQADETGFGSDAPAAGDGDY